MQKKVLILILFFLSSCIQTIKHEKQEIYSKKEQISSTQQTTSTQPTVSIIKVEENFPFFKDTGDIANFFKSAKLNLEYLKTLSNKKILYNFGDRKITPALLIKTNEKIIEIMKSTDDINNLNKLILENFEIYELKPSTNEVIFSSYYEPILEASLTKTKEYKYPIYKRPPDMIEVNLEDFDEKYKGQKLTGRLSDNKLVPYFTRDEIDYKKILVGKNLELAYFKSMADVMDLHIEGSGILKLTDGKYIKAKFAATNSQKFKGWMSALVDMGLVKREDLTAKTAKEFIDSNPELERAVLSQNKRYTFFKLEEIKDIEAGPEGTYGYPLVPARSIAIDNSLIPLGALAFMQTNFPDVDEKGTLYGIKPDSRFVFCHDTGGAIKGARVDFFIGNGDKAKTFAYSLWEKGKLYLLIVKNTGDKI